jgi:hypothetical protein
MLKEKGKFNSFIRYSSKIMNINFNTSLSSSYWLENIIDHKGLIAYPEIDSKRPELHALAFIRSSTKESMTP